MTDLNHIVDQAYRAVNAALRDHKEAKCFVMHMTNVRDMVRDHHTWETYMRVFYNADNMRTYMFMGLPIAEHSFDELKDKVLVA
jgi:hypothetical protein